MKNKLLRRLNSDDIFRFAIFLLPFENFFFAPSYGWAAITPIFLFIYCLFNYRYIFMYLKKYSKILYISILIIIINLFICFLTNFNLIGIINTLIPLGLGFIIFFSILIYYNKKNNFKNLSKIIFISYFICFIVGIVQFLTIKLQLFYLYDFFSVLFKRNYLVNNRVQFFFTEPSFIGMHVFGVLLPFYYFSKKRSILFLIFLYCVGSILLSCGVRIILDVLVVLVIVLFSFLIRNKKYKLLFLMPLCIIFFIFLSYNFNYRVKKIIDNGIYADGSLASRYFRVQSSIYGYLDSPNHVLFGYGMGNSIIPLRKGYDLARAKYKSSYLREVIMLGDPNYYDDSVSYCFYIRIISEFGILIFIYLIFNLFLITKQSRFKYKYEYLFIMLYLYLQFESYAFYALWIFISFMLYTKRREKCVKKK